MVQVEILSESDYVTGKYHGLDPKPGDLTMTKSLWTERVPVAIGSDELW